MQALEQQKLNTVLSEFVADCKSVFGDKLCDVRLFGSYARGDHNEDSDIDIINEKHLDFAKTLRWKA